MRTLIYGINYSPELTGIGKYTGEMGSWLAQDGQQVDVITTMPYYPEWAVHPSHKGKWWFTEQIDGVNIHRCPFYVPEKATSAKRILHEFSFMLSSLFFWIPIFFGKRYDVVICLSPPFHLGLIPVLYKKLRRVPLWCHIQDLQIDMAKDLGMIKNRRFLQLMFAVEAYILRNCTVVSTISEGMVHKIAQKHVVKNNCLLFPNWVDGDYIKPLPTAQSLRAEFGLSASDKVMLYSGSLGEKQGLDLIIEAARSFVDQPEVIFLIVGSGCGKDKLEALVEQYGLSNVRFYPLQSYAKLAALLATADVHLVLQKKSASDLVLPSKLTGILAAGGCALVSALPGTTLHTVVGRNKMGLLIEPESVEALVSGIRTAISSDLTKYRTNARIYAENNLNKQLTLGRFTSRLRHAANGTSPLRSVKKRQVIKPSEVMLTK